MSERCPRCNALLFRDGADRLCFNCGTLSDPADRERALAHMAAEEAWWEGRRRRKAERPPGMADDPAVAEIIAEFGDIPVEAWDAAASIASMADANHWRKRLAAVRRRVDAGEFSPAPAPRAPDEPPADPERWLAWRVDHGLPISAELLERELGISWVEAERAMASSWYRYLRGFEA